MWICIIDVSHPVARINAIELAGLAKSDPIIGLYYTDKFGRIIERFSFSFTPPIPSPAYKHLFFFGTLQLWLILYFYPCSRVPTLEKIESGKVWSPMMTPTLMRTSEQEKIRDNLRLDDLKMSTPKVNQYHSITNWSSLIFSFSFSHNTQKSLTVRKAEFSQTRSLDFDTQSKRKCCIANEFGNLFKIFAGINIRFILEVAFSLCSRHATIPFPFCIHISTTFP